MKKFLCVLLLIITFTQTYAQVQQGVVKTPTRRNVNGKITPGQYIKNATVGISFPQNNSKGISVSDNQGKFTFSATSPFYITSVVANKGTYTFLDADFSKKLRSYSSNDIEILVDDPNVLAQVREEAVAHERSKIRKQIRAKEDEIEALKETNKITTAEYNKMLGELSEYRQSSEAIVHQIAEVYATTDFDKIDEFNSQLLAFVEDGDFSSADSLLKTKGSKEEQFARIKETDTAIDKTIHDALKAKEYNNKAKESFAQQLYIEHIKFLQQPLMQDSALYCLKLRADLDTTNVDYMWDYANLTLIQNKFSDAIDYFARCGKISNSQGDFGTAIQALIQVAYLYLKMECYPASINAYLTALEIEQNLNFSSFESGIEVLAQTLAGLGNATQAVKDYDTSEKYYLEAIKQYNSLFETDPQSYRASLAIVQNALGCLYSKLENYSKCEKYYKLALHHFEILNEGEENVIIESNLSMVQNNLGILYKNLDKFVESEMYLKKSLDIRQTLFQNNPNAFREDLVDCLYSLAGLHLNMQNYQDAEKYYEMALSHIRNLYSQEPMAYTDDLAKVVRSLMILYARTNEEEKFDQYTYIALDLYTTLYDLYPSMYVDELKELYLVAIPRIMEKGNLEMGTDMARKCYSLDTSNNKSRIILANCLNTKAYQYVNKCEYKDAMLSINEAITLIADEANLYDTKGEILLLQGKNDEALAMWKKVLELNPKFLDNYPNGTNLSNGLKKLGLIK